MTGPLHGLKVIEVGSIGPGPFTAMMLADMGADVIRLARPTTGAEAGTIFDTTSVVYRGRPSLVVNLKRDEDRELVLRLAESADVLIEGFRPGVMERLGLGPDELLARGRGRDAP